MYNHFKHQSAPGLENLWVITMVSNPVRYRSRYDLYQRFKTELEKVGANLFTVELALGDRPFEITTADNPYNLQLRHWDELWLKEQALNLGIAKLPRTWEYVIWLDADVSFTRPDWLEETCHLLQRYKIIQMFQNAIDLGPDGEVINTHKGFVWAWENGLEMPYGKKYGYGNHYHPGFGWGCRREAFDELGGLFSVGILGAGDHHMALSLIGKVDQGVSKQLAPGYLRELLMWQDRATKHIKQDIGYMKGTLIHNWHGRKADRKYVERWEILLKYNYDPDTDLKPDWQGLWQFSDQGERMRNDIRKYFNQRNEDATEL